MEPPSPNFNSILLHSVMLPQHRLHSVSTLLSLLSYLTICGNEDNVFGETTATQEIYTRVAKAIIESAMLGVNGTIFAYGQTSSGKTHTMMGNPDQPGIIPLALSEIFESIQRVRFFFLMTRINICSK